MSNRLGLELFAVKVNVDYLQKFATLALGQIFVSTAVMSKKAPKPILYRRKKGRRAPVLLAEAERSASPRISAGKRSSAKRKLSNSKAKRFANLNRAGNLSGK